MVSTKGLHKERGDGNASSSLPQRHLHHWLPNGGGGFTHKCASNHNAHKEVRTCSIAMEQTRHLLLISTPTSRSSFTWRQLSWQTESFQYAGLPNLEFFRTQNVTTRFVQFLSHGTNIHWTTRVLLTIMSNWSSWNWAWGWGTWTLLRPRQSTSVHYQSCLSRTRRLFSHPSRGIIDLSIEVCVYSNTYPFAEAYSASH